MCQKCVPDLPKVSVHSNKMPGYLDAHEILDASVTTTGKHNKYTPLKDCAPVPQTRYTYK